MAARPLYEVRDAGNAQAVPEYPVENRFDTLTGRRLRGEYLDSRSGGDLLIGGIVFERCRSLFPPRRPEVFRRRRSPKMSTDRL